MIKHSYLLYLIVLWSGAVAAERGLLWQVDGGGQAADSYLLATMHSSDRRVTTYSSELHRVLKEVTSITLELTMDPETLLSTALRMMITDGATLDVLIGKTLFNQLVPLLTNRGIDRSQAKLYKPWAMFLLLSIPPQQSGIALDLKLYNEALKRQLPTFGLESVDEQLDIFDKMPLADQIELLSDLVGDYGEIDEQLEQMVGLYSKGDLEGLQRFSERSMEGLDPALKGRIEGRLIIKRNRRMVDRMLPRLAKGSSLIAVGALQLPGSEGIIALLRKRGFRLTPLY